MSRVFLRVNEPANHLFRSYWPRKAPQRQEKCGRSAQRAYITQGEATGDEGWGHGNRARRRRYVWVRVMSQEIHWGIFLTGTSALHILRYLPYIAFNSAITRMHTACALGLHMLLGQPLGPLHRFRRSMYQLFNKCAPLTNRRVSSPSCLGCLA